MQTKKYVAELSGTSVLVFLGASAIVAIADGVATVGYLGIALALSLTSAVLAYTLGPVSGGHFNPAVTIGLVAPRRHPARDLVPYIVVQIIGAALASAVLYVIASGVHGRIIASSGSLGQNSYGALATTGVVVAEIVLTFVLVWTVLAVPDKSYAYGAYTTHSAFGGLAIGLSMLVIHFAGIGFSSAGVNPARSIGPALFIGGTALSQPWVFVGGPIVGGLIAARAYTATSTRTPQNWR